MIITTSDMYGYDGTNPAQVPTPMALPNLVAWYKASDFDKEVDGSEIAYWKNSGYCPQVDMTLYAIGNSGNRPTVSRNSINSTMTSITNGSSKRGLITGTGVAFLASKTTWTWFGVVMFTSRAAENNVMALSVAASEARMDLTTAGQLQLTYGNVGAYSSISCPSLNDWHFIVITNTSDTEVAYLDGVAGTWHSTPGTPQFLFTNFTMCEGNSLVFFTGSIAEGGIYDRALSASELTMLFNYFKQRYGLY
jgi:hypothetical protein